MYTAREIFPAAPLALVAAEVRFTDAPRLRRQETLDDVSIALEDRFPVVEAMHQVKLDAQGVSPAVATPSVILKNRSSTESVSISAGSVTYETTAYKEFPDLVHACRRICSALIGSRVKPAIQRIGLRYIDEIRVPTPITDARDWEEWIDDRLIDHLEIGPKGKPVTMTQGMISYDLGEHRGLNFRFAALPEGAVVSPQTLKRTPFVPGPFFVLDLDGFQEFPDLGNITLLSADIVEESLRAVHAPGGETFQSAITEKARALFRRSAQ